MHAKHEMNREGPESAEVSMEGLLQAASQVVERLLRKEVAYARVVQVVEGKVLVDIGEKREGVVPLADFKEGKPPALESRIPVLLERKGREDSPTLLSYKKAKALLAWEELQKSFQAKTAIKGKVQQVIKGGYIVDLDGLGGFLPLSHSQLRGSYKPTLAVGARLRCHILEMNAEKRQVVVSRKAVLEEEDKARREKMFSKIKVNDICRGWISRVGEPGLFVNLGGLEGLVHTADVSWREPQKALKAYTRGQRVKVKILRIDPDSGKVGLGLKQLTPNPADALNKRFPPKSSVSGKVESVAPEGAKVTLKEATPGFLPASEFATLAPTPGSSVKAVVLGVNPATFEVTLSMKRLEEIEDRKRVQQYMKPPPPLTLGQLLTPEEETGG